jgi:hypothetical protein
MLIVVGGMFLLIVFSLVRGALRRKPKKSRSRKKQRTTKRTSSRRSPPRGNRSSRPLAEELLDMAGRAGVKPARRAEREVERVVKASPGAAIPLAWGPIEQRIERAAERVGAEPDDLVSTVDMLRYLEAESSLSNDHARLLHTMRQLRNRAAHGELSKDEVDVAGAKIYGRLARSLTDLLDKLR